MKKIKYIIAVLFVALSIGCEDSDQDTTFADDAAAPQNLTALFTITQDNSGLVTIAPHGEGVTRFEIFYGDGTTEPASVNVGEKTSHTYAEGTYTVKLIGYSINGKSTEMEQPLTVSFVAPENLAVNIATVVGNPFQVNVTATADYETYFEVWFDEDTALPPVQFNEGQTATYTYAAIGTYTVTVVAYSGGVATATYTGSVTISNPVSLPLTFETNTYNFANFGNAVTTVIDNPDPTGINTSSKVARQVKNAGSETWAGSLVTLDTPITNLATMPYFKMKVWSPAVGTTFLLKIENLANNTINHEVQAVTTVANQWEELIYDFSNADANQTYNNVVVFCNFNVTGAGDEYYFDDVEQSVSGVPMVMPITFENTSLDYTFTDFLGAASAVENNPVSGGINTSNTVLRILKSTGGQDWAGSWILLSEPVDFSTQGKIKMKVYSPTANTPVIFKFENIDNTSSVEKNVSTTVANQWEEMTFDFTGTDSANNYQRVVVFMNAGVAGTNQTYYIDDIKQSN
ncbi:hypothetical protein [Flavobacterium akiainvivens]|uniref:hypothetical protein n=1 Tax=Flavobacterium akiainvivens TaxID=1202724 RepID=UPI0006C89BC0|nr:hypothetical protein [Flavobacterium akiainvivens]SFQ50883.1 hypothetical protein SAMN05444144_106134 [Flavobacterium akiainvivens]